MGPQTRLQSLGPKLLMTRRERHDQPTSESGGIPRLGSNIGARGWTMSSRLAMFRDRACPLIQDPQTSSSDSHRNTQVFRRRVYPPLRPLGRFTLRKAPFSLVFPPSFLLSSMSTKPILIAKHSRLGTFGAMIKKAANQWTKGTSRHQGPELSLSSSGDSPDPRLVELVRLLARRAARQWFEEMKAEPGSKGS